MAEICNAKSVPNDCTFTSSLQVSGPLWDITRTSMGFPWAKVDNKKRADHYKNQPDFYNTIYNGCLTIAG